MSDPVLVARAKLARASHKGGDPARATQARQELAYALLVRAIQTYAPQLAYAQIYGVERALAVATLEVLEEAPDAR